MPLHNRYVVAAVSEDGDKLAFLTEALTWVSVKQLREAAIFQSQYDATVFISRNKVTPDLEPRPEDVASFDHIQPVFVTVNGKDAYDFSTGPDGETEAPTMAGIYG